MVYFGKSVCWVREIENAECGTYWNFSHLNASEHELKNGKNENDRKSDHLSQAKAVLVQVPVFVIFLLTVSYVKIHDFYGPNYTEQQREELKDPDAVQISEVELVMVKFELLCCLKLSTWVSVMAGWVWIPTH